MKRFPKTYRNALAAFQRLSTEPVLKVKLFEAF